MRLTRIKLAGFKSFVDPATVELPGNITAIVGPNGCGKSNVIDAVRWVMGESSARNLRGVTMTDVIFNGSSSRKPVGQASIELIFDNSNQSLGGEYAAFNEISVRRVVGRDAHSDYYLNGTRCRRKDITDLFLGTGIGPRSYAIIEQGMISNLIEARPEELRVYIDEAAGVSKYKERRRETESRLQTTRENLDRLSDLRDEIGRQLERLKRQARQAERYTTFKQEEKLSRGALEFLRRERLKGEQGAINLQIERQRERLEHWIASQRDLETQQIQTQESNHSKLEAQNKSQAQRLELSTEIARIEQTIAHRQQQRFELEQRMAQLETEKRQHQKELLLKREARTQLATRFESNEVARHQSDLTHAESQKAAQRLEALYSLNTQEHERFLSSSSEPLSRLKSEQTCIEQFEQQLKYGEKQHQRLIKEQGELLSDETQKVLDQLSQDGARLKGEIELKERELDALLKSAQDERQSAQSEREQLTLLRDEITQWRAQLASLELLQKSALTEEEALLRSFLKENALKTGSNSDEKPSSLLSELVVKEGWERAVEVVLNESISGVLLNEIEPYYRPFHAHTESGGVLLAAQANSDDLRLSAHSALQPLSEQVTHPEIARRLVANVYCASNLEEALASLHLLSTSDSIVLPDGFQLGVGWVRRPKQNDPTIGLLKRKQQISSLKPKIAQAEEREQRSAQTLERLKQKIVSLDREREQIQKELQSLHREWSQNQGRFTARTVRLEQVKERLERVTRELEEWSSNQAQTEEALALSRARLVEAEQAQKSLEKESQQRVSERNQLKLELDQAQSTLQAAIKKSHQFALARQEIELEAKTIEAEIKRLEMQALKLQMSEKELLTQRQALASETQDPVRQKLNTLLDQRALLEEELRVLQSETDQLQQKLSQLEKARRASEQAQQKHKDEIQTLKLSLHEIQLHAQQSERELALLEMEKFTSLETLLAQFDLPLKEEDLLLTESEWDERVQNLHRRIERLGPINLAAIEEYAVQNERMTWLNQQNDDLCEAIEALENAIHKIDQETRARFEETFDRVNQGIQKMFPRLFGGGQAYLELMGEDLLDSGVTLMARPPGKRISNIQLMSGGEKALTAIALVFSIFELNPAPFCMLDEVDAPLDDHNIGRFKELVREMSERVQFIIITHNKVTMEIATHLTGVTMSEPGVSRLVTVNMQEAMDIVEPALSSRH